MHFGVKGAKVHRVQIWSKHAKVADGRHPPTNCAKAVAHAACARLTSPAGVNVLKSRGALMSRYPLCPCAVRRVVCATRDREAEDALLFAPRPTHPREHLHAPRVVFGFSPEVSVSFQHSPPASTLQRRASAAAALHSTSARTSWPSRPLNRMEARPLRAAPRAAVLRPACA